MPCFRVQRGTSSVSSLPSPANSTGFATPVLHQSQQILLNDENNELVENGQQRHTIPPPSVAIAKSPIQNFVPQRDMTSFMPDAQQFQPKKLASENLGNFVFSHSKYFYFVEANNATIPLTGSTYSNYLDENRTLFENEVTYARENIQRCLTVFDLKIIFPTLILF